jgi:excisionase family DNA binding protein
VSKSRNNTTFTPSEVANALGVKVSTVYAWISRKELLANRRGRNREISDLQLASFLTTRRFNVVIDLTERKRPPYYHDN